MSENLKTILEKLKREPEFLEKVKAEAEKNPPKSTEDMLELANKYGFKLTEADLSYGKDLTEEELKQAAGGKNSASTVSKATDVIKDTCDDAVYGLCVAFFGFAYNRV